MNPTHPSVPEKIKSSLLVRRAMSALPRVCAALACLVIATPIANAAPGVTYTSKTQINNNGEVFSISVFPGKARYTTSVALARLSLLVTRNG